MSRINLNRGGSPQDSLYPPAQQQGNYLSHQPSNPLMIPNALNSRTVEEFKAQWGIISWLVNPSWYWILGLFPVFFIPSVFSFSKFISTCLAFIIIGLYVYFGILVTKAFKSDLMRIKSTYGVYKLSRGQILRGRKYVSRNAGFAIFDYVTGYFQFIAEGLSPDNFIPLRWVKTASAQAGNVVNSGNFHHAQPAHDLPALSSRADEIARLRYYETNLIN